MDTRLVNKIHVTFDNINNKVIHLHNYLNKAQYLTGKSWDLLLLEPYRQDHTYKCGQKGHC